ncbi:MAG: EAL domain-containing protein [Cellvibrionaceae bacterium]
MEKHSQILLVVEDHAEFLLIERLLAKVRHNRYQLHWCAEFRSAYREVTSQDYDVVLLDYHCFDKRGKNLLKAAISQNCQTPIVVMTDKHDLNVDQDALQLGAADYLVKGHIDVGLLERSLRYALERKRSEQELVRRAHYDPLTGVPNRILFRDRLEHALSLAQREKRPFALLYIDLDGFKQVNDQLGHEGGDFLLQTVAKQLQNCVRSSDSIARMGGDEFTVLLEQVDSSADAVFVAQKIIDDISQPGIFNSRPYNIGCSIGIAMYPSAGEDADTLQRHADAAMYQAKFDSGNQFYFFTEEMNLEARNQLLLEADLRRAIRRGEFEVHYQPKVCLASGEVGAVEALVRWRHPERGLLGPEEFIVLAEDTGLVGPIGHQVLHMVCRDIQWRKERGCTKPLVSINLSFRQFLDDKLVEHVAAQMKAFNIQPGELEFEVAETVLMNNPEQVTLCMRALNHLGAVFALDDFGTGATGFLQLQKLPIHTLKVDQGFVANIAHSDDAREIIHATVGLAKAMGKTVVAEGVETRDQYKLLKLAECDFAQGYYFSAPLTCEELQSFQGGSLEKPVVMTTLTM